ncbi:MAG: sulfotransferase domain-containing protein [Candidatus Nealsonbacteria bacterium]|nr:sulfotransferase domain-containing protein [Candidatus Nealsonbacteria bacterium]
MKDLPRGLLIKARIWRALFPLRWVLSAQLWVIGRVVQGCSVALFGIHVAIDFVRLMCLDYTARPDDVFLVTYPRSGTTWLQMIMYQLTTDGSMDFQHIAEVCPWFERVAMNRRNLDAMPSPRIFKSHLPHIWIPKRRCRYIYVARNGMDVAVSFYGFHKSHLRYRGTFEQFFNRFMRGWVVWGSWFYHVSRWWRYRNQPNVLFLKYEDMIADLEGCVRRIIALCELDVAEERMPEILRRCSFEFMKEHEEKFDFATEVMLEKGFTPDTFIRGGRVGDGADRLDDEQTARFQSKYKRCVAGIGLTFEDAADASTGDAHGK